MYAIKKILTLLLSTLLLASCGQTVSTNSSENDSNETSTSSPTPYHQTLQPGDTYHYLMNDYYFDGNFIYYLMDDDSYKVSIIDESQIKRVAQSYEGVIEIPSMVNGKKVTAIGSSLNPDVPHTSIPGITGIIFPDTLKTINQGALDNLENLTSIQFSSNLEKIEDYAICRCPSLKTITMPESLLSIGNGSFENTGLESFLVPKNVESINGNPLVNVMDSYPEVLTSLSVSPENKTYDSRNDCNAIIQTKENKLISGCSTTIIPNDVVSIGAFAFYGCKKLKTITIPASVMNIETNAFHLCSFLTDIYCETTEKPEGWTEGWNGCPSATVHWGYTA